MPYMKRAVELARMALGGVSPNPAVGAVLVKDGKVVGEGHTRPPGQDHAEVVALKQAGEKARGATLYVSLEPCNHFGRTPPCTEAIIGAGVAEVRYAIKDPNPKVDGKGAARLREAGVQVSEGEEAEAARDVIEAYAKHVTGGRPFVTAKYAMSLDGKLATKTGESWWLTGTPARRYAHQLRAESDAVMVGVGTVLTDNPMLTARDEADKPLPRQPLRVVVDSHGRIPLTARVVADGGKTLIAVADAAEGTVKRLNERGVEVVRFLGPRGLVALDELMAYLGGKGVTSVLTEGGARLLGGLFDERLVDKVVAFVAPIVVGGHAAPSPVEGDGVEKLADALRLTRVTMRQVGDDTVITGYC
jgi:diaminohydroxyphosphoribosylaminopyrimidine deaminase/5-amino-6-(5-phosphoribosylamino)uracil reductase